MIANVAQPKLAKALKACARIVHGKSALPILENVLLRAEGEHIVVETNNLESAVRVYVPAKVEETGEITVPVKDLVKLVNTMDKAATIELRDYAKTQTLNLTVGMNTVSLKGIDAGEMPIVDWNRGQPVATLPFPDFKRLALAHKFTADDTARPLLTQVKFTFGNNQVVAVASDGFHMIEETAQDVVVPIVPVSALMLNVALSDFLTFADKKYPVEDCIASGDQPKAFLHNGDISMKIELMEGDFPDYKNIIPAQHAFQAYVGREAFINALKILAPIAKDCAETSILTVSQPSLDQPVVFTMTANSAEKGNGTQSFAGTWESSLPTQFGETKAKQEYDDEGMLKTTPSIALDQYRIAFNLQLILLALQTMSTPQVWIGLNSPTQPIHLKPATQVDTQVVTMPMSIGK